MPQKHFDRETCMSCNPMLPDERAERMPMNRFHCTTALACDSQLVSELLSDELGVRSREMRLFNRNVQRTALSPNRARAHVIVDTCRCIAGHLLK